MFYFKHQTNKPCVRSACHVALKEWELAAADARAAIESDATYLKGVSPFVCSAYFEMEIALADSSGFALSRQVTIGSARRWLIWEG
jgi:hypothetical protein